MLGSPFLSWGDISVSTFSFCGSGLMPCLGIILQKNRTNVYLKWHLSVFSFRFTCWHICRTFHSVSLWSLLMLSYPTTKMSSAMPNTFGKSLNILSIFHWNMSSLGDAHNGSLLYLYLPNWNVNNDLSFSFRLWYPELTSISENI